MFVRFHLVDKLPVYYSSLKFSNFSFHICHIYIWCTVTSRVSRIKECRHSSHNPNNVIIKNRYNSRHISNVWYLISCASTGPPGSSAKSTKNSSFKDMPPFSMSQSIWRSIEPFLRYYCIRNEFSIKIVLYKISYFMLYIYSIRIGTYFAISG